MGQAGYAGLPVFFFRFARKQLPLDRPTGKDVVV
jgi:hypothetical protein